MSSRLVSISGAVGKQVIPVTAQAELEYVTITPSAANATVKIRDGNASGEVVFYARVLSAQGSTQFEVCHKFTKGMHVKVIGTLAEAYLVIN